MWFGLFHSSNTAGWSYILLILVRPAAYFPWVFKCNFMCELVAARLWKTDILTVHRCVNNRTHTHTQFTNTGSDINTNKQHIQRMHDLSALLWCIIQSIFLYVWFICWGLRGEEKKESWHPKMQPAPGKKLTNSQTNLIPMLIGLSSVSITCFTWQTCKLSHTTSLCTTKAHHRLLSIIPKHWHDCTPLYSRPNYPGPL